MRRFQIAATALVLSLMVGPAFADPAYKADTVVDFFTKQSLGASRAVCIGTEKECPQPSEQPKFDLLVNFDFNSDRLTPSAKENLNQFAEALRDPRLASAEFEIDGHTDAKGTEQYNLGLSERRAGSVMSYLVDQGLDAKRFKAKGFGMTKPRVEDPYDPINRRVETRMIGQ